MLLGWAWMALLLKPSVVDFSCCLGASLCSSSYSCYDLGEFSFCFFKSCWKLTKSVLVFGCNQLIILLCLQFESIVKDVRTQGKSALCLSAPPGFPCRNLENGLSTADTLIRLILVDAWRTDAKLIWVVVNVGSMLLSELVYPFPNLDTGLQFLVFKEVSMEVAFMLWDGLGFDEWRPYVLRQTGRGLKDERNINMFC